MEGSFSAILLGHTLEQEYGLHQITHFSNIEIMEITTDSASESDSAKPLECDQYVFHTHIQKETLTGEKLRDDFLVKAFLVGAFFLKEKSPTITVGSFFFSLQSHSEWSTFYNLFIFHICPFSKPESGGSILALNHIIFMLPRVQQVRPKGPSFGFFRHYATFSRKFSDSIKG